MARPDILQEPTKEIVKELMENLLKDMEQCGRGNLCDLDAVNVLKILRDQGFYTKVSKDKIIVFEGPLNYYNHKKGKFTVTDHHTVAQINEDWVFDLASKPGERVYYNLEDYKNNSGIGFPTYKDN